MAGFWDSLVSAVRDATDGGGFSWGRDTSSSREPAQSSRPGFSPAPRQSERPGFSPAPTRRASSGVATSPVRQDGSAISTLVRTANTIGQQATAAAAAREDKAAFLEQETAARRRAAEQRYATTDVPPSRSEQADTARRERAAYFDRIVGTGRNEQAVELTAEQYANLNPLQRAAVDFNTELLSTRQTAGGERRDLEDRRSRTEDFLSERGLSSDELDAYLGLDRAISSSILEKLGDREALDLAGVGPTPRPNVTTPEQQPLVDAASSARTQATTAVNRASMMTGLDNSVRSQTLATVFDTMIGAGGNYTTDDVVQGLAQLNQANGTDITPREVWEFAASRVRAAEQAKAARVDFTLPVTDPQIETLNVAEIRKRYGL